MLCRNSSSRQRVSPSVLSPLSIGIRMLSRCGLHWHALSSNSSKLVGCSTRQSNRGRGKLQGTRLIDCDEYDAHSKIDHRKKDTNDYVSEILTQLRSSDMKYSYVDPFTISTSLFRSTCYFISTPYLSAISPMSSDTKNLDTML